MPPHDELPFPELPYHVLLEERQHFMKQIQQLQQEKDSALTRNADLIAFLRSEKTRLEYQLKAQKSLVHIKEEELIKLRRQLLEATNIITAGNALIHNLRQALAEATDHAHLPPFTVGQQNQFPPVPLPPQDEVASLRLHKVQSSQEELEAVSHMGLEDCIPMDETEDSVIMEARHSKASEEECSSSPIHHLSPNPSFLDPTTSSPLERAPTADKAPLPQLESCKKGDTSNINPVIDHAKIQFANATQKTKDDFQAQMNPEDFDVWQVLEALIGTIFIEGRANTTIVCEMLNGV
ncbi:hypothetical protein FRC00_005860 [Tulasnella sp. 408]|nr:hypothetical protein FRC00_005860 [Tulasnella sp. 408]